MIFLNLPADVFQNNLSWYYQGFSVIFESNVNQQKYTASGAKKCVKCAISVCVHSSVKQSSFGRCLINRFIFVRKGRLLSSVVSSGVIIRGSMIFLVCVERFGMWKIFNGSRGGKSAFQLNLEVVLLIFSLSSNF